MPIQSARRLLAPYLSNPLTNNNLRKRNLRKMKMKNEDENPIDPLSTGHNTNWSRRRKWGETEKRNVALRFQNLFKC